MARLAEVNVVKLKGLENVTIELPFCGVVALMGGNGSGKSTLLHAMTCLYDPPNRKKAAVYKWSDYFISYNKNTWSGSEVFVKFYENDGSVNPRALRYWKDEGRWKPRYDGRPSRNVLFIPLSEFAPHIEIEKYRGTFSYESKEGEEIQKVCDIATNILGRSYVSARKISRDSGTVREFLEVDVDVGGQIRRYNSFFMGAGEQKIFYLLDKLVTMPKGSLIVIEEIESFLHGRALRNLIRYLVRFSKDRELQIVFSSHWSGLFQLEKEINIFCLYNEPGRKVVCNPGADVFTRYELSGDTRDLAVLKVWVEDDVAQLIVEEAAWSKEIQRLVTVRTFGAIENAFTVAASIALNNDSFSIVVIDGDVVCSEEEWRDRIRKRLGGNDRAAERDAAMNAICQFKPPDSQSPEAFVLTCARSVDETRLMASQKALKREVLRLPEGMNPKTAIEQIAHETGETRRGICEKLIGVARVSDGWDDYIEGVADKLQQKVSSILGEAAERVPE